MTMGKWPTYSPTCLHKITPPHKPPNSHKHTHKHRRNYTSEELLLVCVTCVNDSPGAQYMLEMASLSQDSATSTQLQKYVS